jgi:hypothetical protein
MRRAADAASIASAFLQLEAETRGGMPMGRDVDAGPAGFAALRWGQRQIRAQRCAQ